MSQTRSDLRAALHFVTHFRKPFGFRWKARTWWEIVRFELRR